MKKFVAILMAIMMVLACTAAFAEGEGGAANSRPAHEVVHGAASPAFVSEQEAKITIKGLHDTTTTGDPYTLLPSEYHVIINWHIQDGVYEATATDVAGEGGFKNFTWNCSTLNYDVTQGNNGADDPRKDNWTTKPEVWFEVVNNSTPDLTISATAALNGDDAWASYIASNSIATQNTAIGTQTISPVSKANMGNGKSGYSVNTQSWGAECENEYEYKYVFNWDYNALNATALALYKAGNAQDVLTNTFKVTISAGGGT